MVTVYTSFGWGPCMATKSWLRNNNFTFIEKNISDDIIREEILALGYRTTPVIITEKGPIVGFNPTKLSEALL